MSDDLNMNINERVTNINNYNFGNIKHSLHDSYNNCDIIRQIIQIIKQDWSKDIYMDIATITLAEKNPI